MVTVEILPLKSRHEALVHARFNTALARPKKVVSVPNHDPVFRSRQCRQVNMVCVESARIDNSKVGSGTLNVP